MALTAAVWPDVRTPSMQNNFRSYRMDNSVQHLADTIEASRSRALGENGGYKGGEEILRSVESASYKAASK